MICYSFPKIKSSCVFLDIFYSLCRLNFSLAEKATIIASITLRHHSILMSCCN